MILTMRWRMNDARRPTTADAHLAYTRLVAVNKDRPNLIAQQDLDTAEARDATAQGGLEAAKSTSRSTRRW